MSQVLRVRTKAAAWNHGQTITSWLRTLALAAGAFAALALMALTLLNYVVSGDTMSWLGFGFSCGAATICLVQLYSSDRTMVDEMRFEDDAHKN